MLEADGTLKLDEVLAGTGVSHQPLEVLGNSPCEICVYIIEKYIDHSCFEDDTYNCRPYTLRCKL